MNLSENQGQIIICLNESIKRSLTNKGENIKKIEEIQDSDYGNGEKNYFQQIIVEINGIKNFGFVDECRKKSEEIQRDLTTKIKENDYEYKNEIEEMKQEIKEWEEFTMNVERPIVEAKLIITIMYNVLDIANIAKKNDIFHMERIIEAMKNAIKETKNAILTMLEAKRKFYELSMADMNNEDKLAVVNTYWNDMSKELIKFNNVIINIYNEIINETNIEDIAKKIDSIVQAMMKKKELMAKETDNVVRESVTNQESKGGKIKLSKSKLLKVGDKKIKKLTAKRRSVKKRSSKKNDKY